MVVVMKKIKKIKRLTIIMSEGRIYDNFETLKEYHGKYLFNLGITLPKLKKSNNQYVKKSLVLAYLVDGYPNTKEVTKSELTAFIKQFYPDITDVQQARHLGRQDGWNILSGRRGDITKEIIARDSYKLVSLKNGYLDSNIHRKSVVADDDWVKLKQEYNYRCCSCGSKEGAVNYVNRSVRTQLQKGHMNPTMELVKGNIIPQCQECNRGDKNHWIYNERGRVVGLSDEELLRRVKKISDPMQVRSIVEFLTKKFQL
jgi:hypothetical protein